ncbi:MAG: RNA 3'-terminal phosphate cyclase [Lentisphaeraceae bacterium]|nr:RNA 3'-terminal phosphate cyclase [Lentisphaeraceae bacterium]
MINIDGSHGEGGGQILRTALALSLLTGKPFSIKNIRATRRKPGIKRQHLACVKAAAEIGGARVEGAELNSMALKFFPSEVRSGDYHFAVGSAGSTSLVLQTVFPPLLLAGGDSTITLEGGTHNPMAPPYDFLEKCFLPQLRKCGVEISSQIFDYGFNPGGGGRFQVKVRRVDKLSVVHLLERGTLVNRRARALVAEIPEIVAEREVKKVQEKLGWNDDELVTEEVERTFGPGNVLTLELNYENVSEMQTVFGERGVRAEAIAVKVAGRLNTYLKSKAPVGEYLADQLLIPLAMAGEGSFICTELSQHTKTNIEVIRYFIDVDIKTDQLGQNEFLVSFSS